MRYTNDTAWLYNREDDGTGTFVGKHFLAAKSYIVYGSTPGDYIGVHKTGDLESYSEFEIWRRQEKYPISGMWKCSDSDTGTIYILSTDSQQILGHYIDASYNKVKVVLYESNQNSSIQRRVSMFDVPAK